MQTMTARELRDFLAGFPDDMPIAATWEGVIAPIRPGNFELRGDKGERLAEGQKADMIVVDVNDYDFFVG